MREIRAEIICGSRPLLKQDEAVFENIKFTLIILLPKRRLYGGAALWNKGFNEKREIESRYLVDYYKSS